MLNDKENISVHTTRYCHYIAGCHAVFIKKELIITPRQCLADSILT